MLSTARECGAKTKRGSSCQTPAVNGDNFCYWHSPKYAKKRTESRAKGGRARHGRKVAAPGGHEPVNIGDVAGVVMLLNRAINDALVLENSLQRARTVGTLAGTLIKALEFSTLEERVTALEEVFNDKN